MDAARNKDAMDASFLFLEAIMRLPYDRAGALRLLEVGSQSKLSESFSLWCRLCKGLLEGSIEDACAAIEMEYESGCLSPTGLSFCCYTAKSQGHEEVVYKLLKATHCVNDQVGKWWIRELWLKKEWLELYQFAAEHGKRFARQLCGTPWELEVLGYVCYKAKDYMLCREFFEIRRRKLDSAVGFDYLMHCNLRLGDIEEAAKMARLRTAFAKPDWDAYKIVIVREFKAHRYRGCLWLVWQLIKGNWMNLNALEWER